MSRNDINEIENRKVSLRTLSNDKAKSILTQEFLNEHIVNQKKSPAKVARETDLGISTIKRYMLKFNVKSQHFSNKTKSKDLNSIITKEYITKEYIENQRTMEDICNELNISYKTLFKRIKSFGFQVKDCVRLTEEQRLNLRWEHLTPLRRHINKKGEKVFDNYIFKCSCGKEVSIFWHNVMQGQRTACGKCDWYEDIKTGHWTNIIRCAKARNLEFNLTKKYVWDLYLKQDKKCIFTGLPVIFDVKGKTTASIDRIDNSKGYIEGNIQIVHKSINIMRGATDVELFKYLCTLVAKNCKVDETKFENKQLEQNRNTTKCE
jgi:hypothetical protein